MSPRPPEASVFAAVGEADRQLLDNVAPDGWRNPQARDRYDLVVLGGGTAGLVTAAIAAGIGARVALVERKMLGGDCLNVGCVPSKAVIRAARAWADARAAASRFGGPPVRGEGDFAAAMDRMRRVRAELSGHDSARRFRDLGVDVFLGHGRFAAPDRIEVEGATLPFRRAVVATGARPDVPPIPGLTGAGYLTNETVFSLTALPSSLAVIGGGPIGCELAQAFARFGARVELIEVGSRILPSEEPDAAHVVHAALAADGVRIHAGARIGSVAIRDGLRVLALSTPDGETELSAEQLLVATGRVPNLESLNLQAAGVDHGSNGIRTDERLRTSNSRVYAIGDVNGRYAFTHASDAQARLVVPNALFHGRAKVTELLVPAVTYTDPEVASVGRRSPDSARDESDDVTVPLREVDRARIDGGTGGYVRIRLAKGSDRIMGATIVAPHAGDLITQVTTAMNAGIGLDRLGATIHPYPTLSEALRKAADAHRRRRLTPRAKALIRLALRVLR